MATALLPKTFLINSFKGGREVDATSKYVPLCVYISSSIVTLYSRPMSSFSGGLRDYNMSSMDLEHF